MSVLTAFGNPYDVPSVLLVAENGASGGIGRYCADLGEAFADRAAVACLCPDQSEDCRTCWLAQQCRARSLPLFGIPMGPKEWREGCKGLAALWRASGRPLVHANGRRGNFLARTLSAAMEGFSFVTTVHGILGLHDRRNLLYRLVDLSACRKASAVIAVSADTRRRLVEAGSPPLRTLHIPNGLRAEDLALLGQSAEARKAAATTPGLVRIGFLGRLSPEKGVEDFGLIARRLHSLGTNTQFFAAGGGPLKACLIEQMRELAAAGVFTYYGEMQDVGQLLREVDVLMMPSRNEGMPYALLEGMAAGCAVAGYGVGGIPEVISDRSLGLLARPADIDGLFRGVLDLVLRPESIEAMGERASDHVRNQFALQARLPMVISAYETAGSLRHGPLVVESPDGWFKKCA